MKYLIITTSGPFYSDWLLQPDWDKVVTIIDTYSLKFTNKERDRNDCDHWEEKKLSWSEIPEDNL